MVSVLSPCLSTADRHPTPGFGLQGQWLSPLHSHSTHIPHTFTRRRQRQRNEALPEQPQKLLLLSSLGTPCHTQQCASSSCCTWHLLQINWVELSRWAELCSCKGLPLLPRDPARHCCANGSQSSPSQTTPVGLCSQVLLILNPYTAKDALNTLMTSAKPMAQPGFWEQHRHAAG